MRSNLAAVPMPDRKPPHERCGAVVVKQIIVNQLMTVEQLEDLVQVRRSRIYMQVSRARSRKTANPIPFYQFGRDLRFDYDEIMEWMRGLKLTK